MAPRRVYLVERGSYTQTVNLPVRRECPDNHRDVVGTPLAVGDVFKEKRFALGLWPFVIHQLVDRQARRTIGAEQQPQGDRDSK